MSSDCTRKTKACYCSTKPSRASQNLPYSMNHLQLKHHTMPDESHVEAGIESYRKSRFQILDETETRSVPG